MSTNFECEFCGSSFVNRSNLVNHQKKTRYCIALRENSDSVEHQCKKCGKAFTRKFGLDRHSITCKEKPRSLAERLEKQSAELADVRQSRESIARELQRLKESSAEEIQNVKETFEKEIQNVKESSAKEIQKLKDEIVSLKLRLAEQKGMLKMRAPVVNNNTGPQYINPKLMTINCDTISPLTIENVKKEVDSGTYTYENYIRGERGLVDFIEGMISADEERNYVCTDTSRNKFHRLIETREWKEDNGANFLNNILDQLKEPAITYYTKICDMSSTPQERDTSDYLMDKTKPMFFGITRPKSKDREVLFNKIRAEVRKLAAV